MNPQQIVGVAVRLLAVVLVFDTIGTAAFSLQFIETGDARNLIGVGVSVGLVSAFALLLWTLNVPLASWLLSGKANAGDEDERWRVDDLYACGFVLLGTYFLFNAIDDVTGLAMAAALRPDLDPAPPMSPGEIAASVSAVLRIMGAVILILGSRGIAGVIHRLRYGGL